MRKVLYVFHHILRDSKEGWVWWKIDVLFWSVVIQVSAAHLVHCRQFVSPSTGSPATKPSAVLHGPAVPSVGSHLQYEILHPCIPHVSDHSAWLVKLPLLCSHYPFNFFARSTVSASFCSNLFRYKVLLHPVEWDSFTKPLRESTYLIDFVSSLENECTYGFTQPFLITKKEAQKLH